MARYVYDSSKVNITISELDKAIDKIENVNSEIKSGIDMIVSARGGEYIQIDSSTILKYSTIVEESIENLISEIRSKVILIEDYNNASFLEKAFSTGAMAVTKFSEGVFTAFENVLDGFCTITGSVVGIFSEDAKNSIGEFVEKDHIGDFFESAYNGGFLSSLEKYSAFSSTSTAANVFKGVGVATGYIAIAYAGGAIGGLASSGSAMAGGTAAVNSLGVNMLTAAVGGIGSGTEDGLQQGLSYDAAAMQGVKRGAIQAGTVFVAGKAAEGLSKIGNGGTTAAVVNSSDDVLKLGAGTTDDVLKLGAGTADDALRIGAGTIDDATSTAARTVTNSTDDVLRLGSGTVDDAASTAAKSGTPKYKTLDDYREAVHSGKYNGDRAAARKDFIDSFGVPKEGSDGHAVYAEAMNAAKGKGVNSPVSSVKPATENVVNKTVSNGSHINSVGDVKVLPSASATTASHVASATQKSVSSIPGIIGGIGAEQAYWEGKNTVPNNDNVSLNFDSSTATSLYNNSLDADSTNPSVVPPIIVGGDSGSSSTSGDNAPTTGDSYYTSPGYSSNGGSGGSSSSSNNSGSGLGNNNPSSPSFISNGSQSSSGNNLSYVGNGGSGTNNNINSSSNSNNIDSIPNTNGSIRNYVNNSPNAIVDSYNNSTIDSYNTTTNNYNYYYDDKENNNKQTTNLNDELKIKTSGLSDEAIKAMVGLGISGVAGAAGYGIYNKNKKDKKDEEDENKWQV